MSYLPAIPAVPPSVVVVIGIVAILTGIWLWARISRTRHVVIQASESVLTAVVQLERIANAMERIAFFNEARSRTAEARDRKDPEHIEHDAGAASSAFS